MDFLILGPLGVRDGDRQIVLGGVRQRALLAMLLLNANEVVSADRLVDELWTGDSRADAAKALHVAISRLRKALQPGRAAGDADQLLITRPPGYELRVEPGQLDLHRFERIVRDGPCGPCRGRRRAALRPFSPRASRSGAALLSPTSPSRTSASRRSRGSRSCGWAPPRTRIAADLARGLGPSSWPSSRPWWRRQPLRERPRAQLMLALYRAGRQAEALEAYADARRVLVEELGLEPSRELQELQRAVLDQDVTLDAPRASGDAPSSGGRSWAGTSSSLQLRAALDRAMSGRGGVALLVGEPGIGKSRLADELASVAQARGARVLVGRCWEAGGAPAFWPWVQSLRAYTRDAEPALLREQLGDGASDLAQLLPELRELFADLPQPATSGPRATASACSTPSPRSSARRPGIAPPCSSWTTCTPPTSRHCSFCSTSRARSATAGCWWSAPSGTWRPRSRRPSPRRSRR